MHERFRRFIIPFVLIAILLLIFGLEKNRSVPVVGDMSETIMPTGQVATPQVIPISNGPLKESILAAGDFLVRQQLPNGEISYQVDIFTDAREFSPSTLRLIGGTGALFTVCRVSGDPKYCEAGDRALDHYLEQIIADETHFPGACFYTGGTCQLGGSALVIDAIYKRWQATGTLQLGSKNLAGLAQNLGYFILSMRKPEGDFYHAFDPYHAGTVDPDYFVIDFPGESLLALIELYEMTGNEFWLAQAHEVNDFMITQPVTEDYWHSLAFSLLARVDKLSRADREYAQQIAETVIAGQVRSLNPRNTSISTGTKIEALAGLAHAFTLSGEEHKWLDPQIQVFITFVRARQLPDQNCNWTISDQVTEKFSGGIFSSCEEPSVRVDGVQHYINGLTTYLEYQSMIEQTK
jgi:hypothetical protein